MLSRLARRGALANYAPGRSLARACGNSEGALCLLVEVPQLLSAPSPNATAFLSQYRAFSSSNTDGAPRELSDDQKKKADASFLGRILTPRYQTYALIGGGTLGALMVGKFASSFVSFFTHLTPQVVGKWGFYAGFGTATFMGALACVTVDSIAIRADPVFKHGE